MGKDKEKKKRDEQNLIALMDILKDPGNQKCADCGERNPRWASITLGVFLCIQCGGHHRKLGTSISKIKSVTLDSWSDEAISTMRQWGNKRANELYCPDIRKHPPPVQNDREMEAYIRMKYEKMMFANGQSRALQTNAQDIEFFAPQLRMLATMGFTNQPRAVKALKKANGLLDAAVEMLVNDSTLDDTASSDRPSISAQSNSLNRSNGGQDYPAQCAQLEAMGFTDRSQNKLALDRTKGNIEEAINTLVEIQRTQSALVKRQTTISSDRPSTVPPPAQRNELVGDLDFFSTPPVPMKNGFTVNQYQGIQPSTMQHVVPSQQQVTSAQFALQPPPMNPNARSSMAPSINPFDNMNNRSAFGHQAVTQPTHQAHLNHPSQFKQPPDFTQQSMNMQSINTNQQGVTFPNQQTPGLFQNTFPQQNQPSTSVNQPIAQFAQGNQDLTQPAWMNPQHSMNVHRQAMATQPPTVFARQDQNPFGQPTSNQPIALSSTPANTSYTGFTQQGFSIPSQPNIFGNNTFTPHQTSSQNQNINKDLAGLFDPISASFQAPVQPAPTVPSARPVDPAAKKDAILSLFHTPNISHQHGMGIGMSNQFPASNFPTPAAHSMQPMAMKPGYPSNSNPFQQTSFAHQPQVSSTIPHHQQSNPFNF